MKKKYTYIDLLEILQQVDTYTREEGEPHRTQHKEFVEWFMKKYNTGISSCIRRRLIPNRYSVSDVKAYITERILDILKKRQAKGKPIEDPKLYFRSLISFYCVEFQRMHGYIYCLPKRPRDIPAEQEISQYGFVYFNTKTTGSSDDVSQLGYIDASLGTEEDPEFTVKGLDPSIANKSWDQLMLMVLPEDKAVLECLFIRNLSIPEASKELGIATSTAYQRRDRGLSCLSGCLATYVDLDQESWEILKDVTKLPEDVIDIKQFYTNR